MRRKLRRVGDDWLVLLAPAHLKALGVEGTEAAVVLQVENGPPPHLVIRRALPHEEGLEAPLQDHENVSEHQIDIPDSATGG